MEGRQHNHGNRGITLAEVGKDGEAVPVRQVQIKQD